MAREEEIIEFGSAAAFEEWIAAHHSTCPGIWLKLRKKDRGADCLDYAQALDVALSYGWIDGQKDKFDDSCWLQRFTPRTSRSKWSKVNREKASALIEQGRMRAPGMAEVERAKADGRWDAAYAGSKTASVPEDLVVALAASPAAAEFFATLDSQNRYSILYRVQDAKKPETRARRIQKFVEMLAQHEKIHTRPSGPQSPGSLSAGMPPAPVRQSFPVYLTGANPLRAGQSEPRKTAEWLSPARAGQSI